MILTEFEGERLSLLGFGTMRLPTLPDGAIDRAQTREMVDYALAHGVNYFDTAYPYHNGLSEVVIGEALRAYPRERWFLADKYPGHQISARYDPAAVFEEQLRKCGVAYFDFYLLHNVYENSIHTYRDPRWGIVDYFREQVRRGRIRHLGFSTHGNVPLMRAFLDEYAEDMSFCQIQLNWLDWTLQSAKEKVELLAAYNIPVWVMEPLRGGRLCQLDDAAKARLSALRPEESVPGWSFRFLQGMPGVKMVLSGMSSLEQMRQNIDIFAERKPLKDAEQAALLDIAEGMKDAVPCTGCRYCTARCPKGLDIPLLLAEYNDARFSPNFNIGMRIDALPVDKRPDACIGCGACARMCPQRIDIPAAMKDFSARLETIPKWADICRAREEAARRARAGD